MTTQNFPLSFSRASGASSSVSVLGVVCVVAALSVPVSPAYAQNFLNKLAEKVQQKAGLPVTLPNVGAANAAGTAGVAGSGQMSAEDARLVEADRADPALNQRPFKPDPRGLGGIYYTNFVLGGESLNQEKAYVITKVLIEFNEDTGIAMLYNRHSFEANDPAKLVPKGGWSTSASAQYIRGLKTVERLLLRFPNAELMQKYKYMQQSYRQDLQGNQVPDKLLPEGLGVLLELEPGVLYVGTAPYAGNKTQPYGHNLLRPGMVMPLLYKEGKAEAAAAWTAEKIVAHYQKIFEAADRASEEANAQVDPNAALLPPNEQAPTRAELDGAKAQWGRVITDRNVADTQTQRKFSFVYAYPTSPWAEMRKKQHVNNSYVDTIVSRSRVFAAVFQDQEGKYWTNRFYLVEKAPLGVYFGERWSGDYDYALPASAVPKALSKEAALKYQNAVKVK